VRRVPVAVAGAGGRMGGAVARALEEAEGLTLAAALGRENLEGDWRGAALVADFTAPSATARIAVLAAARGAGLLVGTTGLDGEGRAALARAAEKVPVLEAPNLSPGMAALTRALRGVLRDLPGYDVEIVERHHRQKRDSPSGTAVALAREAARARGLEFPASLRHGREGAVGPRGAGEIGVHSLRGGGWVGVHSVFVAGQAESLELTHVAESRACFVEGALVALRFLSGAAPGAYTLEDALAAN